MSEPFMRWCPKCDSHKISTERRPYGYSRCDECGHKALTSTFPNNQPPKPEPIDWKKRALKAETDLTELLVYVDEAKKAAGPWHYSGRALADVIADLRAALGR